MPEDLRSITSADIVSLEAYELDRRERRSIMADYKRNRRVLVGPYALFMFEDYSTMLFQVQEMLAIERGGAEQLVDELEAYNPLIPQGSELVATIMFQIEDEVLRRRVLADLGGIEESVVMRFGGCEVFGEAEDDVDRTSASGKASSVQFVHFRFSGAEVDIFRGCDEVMVGFVHDFYSHFGVLPVEVHEALKGDL